jgi:hypothetical protein
VRHYRGTRKRESDKAALHMPPIITPRICIGWSSSQKPIE